MQYRFTFYTGNRGEFVLQKKRFVGILSLFEVLVVS